MQHEVYNGKEYFHTGEGAEYWERETARIKAKIAKRNSLESENADLRRCLKLINDIAGDSTVSAEKRLERIIFQAHKALGN